MKIPAAAFAICAFMSLPAAVPSFTSEARLFPDISLKMPLMSGAAGNPLPSPVAEAYLRTSGGGTVLVDKYNGMELWANECIRARWIDGFGNEIWVATVKTVPPESAVMSHSEFAGYISNPGNKIDDMDFDEVKDVIKALSPVETGEPFRAKKLEGRNFSEVWQFPQAETNFSALVLAVRPVKKGSSLEPWRMLVFIAGNPEEGEAAIESFKTDFLPNVSSLSERESKTAAKTAPENPDDLFRYRSIVNLPDWHFTPVEGYVILDHLPEDAGRKFVSRLADMMPRLKAAYKSVVPGGSACGASQVVRIYRDRDEYISRMGVDYGWTAAVWIPSIRELVMYLPPDGEDALMRTFQHEAFHQYLSYAANMIQTPPWFNEGYAALFEGLFFKSDGTIDFEENVRYAALVREGVEKFALSLPEFLNAGYSEYYSGSDFQKQCNYALGWSIAWFLQKVAPEIPHKPLEGFNAAMLEAVIRTGNPLAAQAETFQSASKLEAFIKYWIEYWSGS